MFAMLFAFAFSASSCSKNDDDNESEKEKEQTPESVVSTFNLSVSDDMVNYLDITVEYYDENGKVQKENMSATNWSKAVTSKLPATVGVCVKATIKEGKDLSSVEKFKYTRNYSIKYQFIDKNGQKLNSLDSDGVSSTSSFNGAKIPALLKENENDILWSRLCTIDAEGNKTTGKW